MLCGVPAFVVSFEINVITHQITDVTQKVNNDKDLESTAPKSCIHLEGLHKIKLSLATTLVTRDNTEKRRSVAYYECTCAGLRHSQHGNVKGGLLSVAGWSGAVTDASNDLFLVNVHATASCQCSIVERSNIRPRQDPLLSTVIIARIA